MEKKAIIKFLNNSRTQISDELESVFDALYELLDKQSSEVKSFDLEKLNDILVEKAESFFNRFNNIITSDTVIIEKNKVYFYHFGSISLIKGPITILYPFILVQISNYRNFIQQLCRHFDKLDKDKLGLEDLFEPYIKLMKSCKPVINKRDVDLLKTITAKTFDENYYLGLKKYYTSVRYLRLKHLQVVGYYAMVNYQALGLIPYMHLSTSKVVIPDHVLPFIEYELHSEKQQRVHDVFRLILVPRKYETEWTGTLKEIGTTGKLTEWYTSYNWDLLSQTTKSTWKWNCDSITPESVMKDNLSKFNHYILADHPTKLTESFIKYLDTIHRLGPVAVEYVSIQTGLKEGTIQKFEQRARKEKFLIPYWRIIRFGFSSSYQVCFPNISVNKSLEHYLSLFPKVTAMRSKEFSRYLIFLPDVAATKLNRFLLEEEKSNKIELFNRQKVTLDSSSIVYGSDLTEIMKL